MQRKWEKRGGEGEKRRREGREWEREVVRWKKRETSVFYLLAYSPTAITHGLSQSSKAWNFIQVPHAGGRGPSTGVIICGVSRCFSRELGRKCSSQDSNRFPHGMPALQATPQSRSLLQSTLEIACRNWRQLIFFKTYLPQRLILNSLKNYEIQMNYQSSNTVFSLMLLLRSL